MTINITAQGNYVNIQDVNNSIVVATNNQNIDVNLTNYDTSASAAASAAKAALYDGPTVDTFSQLANITSSQVGIGEFVRVIETAAVYLRVSSGGDLNYTGSGGVRFTVLTPVAIAFGAVGDGVTNDTSVFKTIELSALGPSIDLFGKTFSLVSVGADAVNGVRLTKDYQNGTLLVDGRKLTFDAQTGFSQSSDSRAKLPKTSSVKSLGLWQVDANNYHVWTHKTGPVWTRQTLNRSGSGIPFNLNETWFKQVMAYKAARESGVVYTGGWATDNATTALNSTDDTYMSGRAQQSITAGDYVETTFTGGGDVYVIFTGRTSGNYVNVLLDGAKTYLTLPADGSTNRYFDSYTSVDLLHRQIVQIASGVPSGSHTIRLTVSSSKNPASAGTRFIFNSLAWSEDATGPWTPEADAPVWATGQSILVNQRRKYGVNYYRATTAGTTGATPPTHTSGTVSDGTVSWAYVTTSSYELIDHCLQAAGSQMEYAYEIKPTGATVLEDVGGALHGNETQTSVNWYLSGASITPPTQSWLVGRDIEVKENITVTHSQIGGGATAVNLTTLRRRFTRDGLEISHEHTLQSSGQFGFFYSAMWPLLHYSGSGFKYAVTNIWSSCDGDRSPADFYGVVNPIIGRTKDTLFVASGNCLQPSGSAGVPSTVPAPYKFNAWMDVAPESVDYYKNANSVFFGKAMNTSGANVASGGYSSMTSKLYAERYSSAKATNYASGDKIRCVTFYGISVQGA